MSLAELLKDGSPVMDLARRFVDAGQEIYLVGGPVRDAFLRRPHWDLDFATSATPAQTLEIVKPIAESVWEQGAEFGTVGAKIGGVHHEITTFRTEKYQPSSRHPEVTFAADIETDLSRRDFTVNAMAVRLPDKTSVDPFDGRADIDARLLKTPADPKDSFSDDPLRMLRAFRFASQLDFKIDRSALDAIEVLRDELRTISAERIRDELSKLLLGEAPGRALKLADATGLVEIFLPELGALKLQQDPVQRHKDVFHHTLAVVDRTEPDLVLRLSALLHDIGKPSTRKIDETGVSFHQHDIVGARMAAARLKALRYSNDVVEAVKEVIRLHHRFHGYEGQWTDSAVRRYVRDAGPHLETLNAMVRADCTTRDPAKVQLLARRVDDLEDRIEELKAKEELEKLRPELDGRKVMELLGLEPGPDVGRAMAFLMEIRLDEGEIGEAEITRRLLEWAEAERVGRFGA